MFFFFIKIAMEMQKQGSVSSMLQNSFKIVKPVYIGHSRKQENGFTSSFPLYTGSNDALLINGENEVALYRQ